MQVWWRQKEACLTRLNPQGLPMGLSIGLDCRSHATSTNTSPSPSTRQVLHSVQDA